MHVDRHQTVLTRTFCACFAVVIACATLFHGTTSDCTTRIVGQQGRAYIDVSKGVVTDVIVHIARHFFGGSFRNFGGVGIVHAENGGEWIETAPAAKMRGARWR